eukprot:TRINITY_DN3742_c0_g3_i3.p2 TRINITY_DN3742_c0_g3~~TRINITY_DN3742_c0_g3_i3.p2  ORF type:complete len:326 (+),score=138.07 TRINITY_DN3742_c0_g3_i3:72-1049(+)
MSAQGLPAHILALFTPRPPPQHLPPQVDKKKIKLDGMADFVDNFSVEKPPKRDEWLSPMEMKSRRTREKVEAHKGKQKEMREKYDPHADGNAAGDPFKTLFVARVSYDTTEKKLKREFEVFGSIKKVRMVYDQKGKPRGYAFIEFEHERDLKNSYKQGDGKKIDGRRVMVDVERGRTVEGWFPRRLGGGRGPGRQGKPKKKKKIAAAALAKEQERKEREAEKDKDKEKKRDKDKDRDEEKKDRKEKDKEKEKDRDRDRGDREDKEKKEKKEDKEKAKEDDKKKDKEKDKDKKRERSRSRDRERDRRGGDRDRDRDRDRKRRRDDD